MRDDELMMYIAVQTSSIAIVRLVSLDFRIRQSDRGLQIVHVLQQKVHNVLRLPFRIPKIGTPSNAA